MRLADHLERVLALDPAAFAIEFEGGSSTWGQLDMVRRAVIDELAKHDLPIGSVIGWVASNIPSTIATLIASITGGYSAGTINPNLPQQALVEELQDQRFPVIVGSPEFWAVPGLAYAARDAGSAGIEVDWRGGAAFVVRPVAGLEDIGPAPHRAPQPDTPYEALSSGTTGRPSRTPHSDDAVIKILAAGEHKENGKGAEGALTLKRSPNIMFRPIAHSGTFATLLALYSARPISLHKKFEVAEVMDAVRRHRPKVLALVPAMIQMIWEAGVSPDLFKDMIAIRSGTAPLDPQLQAAFEAKYGVPILIDYGATELGGVAAWTLADHRIFAQDKRGSVGRVLKGVEVDIIDPETRASLPAGETGLLRLRSDRKGNNWIETTDLAALDADGFLYIRGRADGAINRGGFKVLPEDVAKVIRTHPAVGDVIVVGVPDEKLGQVPVALVEAASGAHLSPEDVRAYAKERLTPYQTPARIVVVDALPRTDSMKIKRSDAFDIAIKAMAA